MPVGGVGSHLGWGIETTWATAATLTDAVGFISESLTLDVARVESDAARSSNRILTTDDWAPGARRVGGSILVPLWDVGLETWWRLLLGDTYAFASSTHTFSPGAIDQSATARIGISGSDSGVPWMEYTGLVPTGWLVDIQSDQAATLAASFVGSDSTVGDTGAVGGTLPATTGVYTLADAGTFTIGGTAWPVAGIRFGASHQLLARHGHGATTILDPRIEQAKRVIAGVVTVEFEDFTTAPTWHTWWRNATATHQTLDIVLTSPAGHTLGINGQCRIDGTDPNVTGEDLVQVDIPIRFVATPGASGDADALEVTVNNGTGTL